MYNMGHDHKVSIYGQTCTQLDHHKGIKYNNVLFVMSG